MIARRLASVTLAISAMLWPGLQAWGQAKTPSWTKVTEHAGWRARDSSGEVVFQGKMWLLGGWFSSRLPCPRDAWSSAEGVHWDLVTAEAPWLHGDLPTTLVHNDRMWIMGGWAGGRMPDASASNQVWSSTDGKSWRQLDTHPVWSPRHEQSTFVFQDKMWVAPGNPWPVTNDVWYIEDVP